jgi:chemotaxis protein MotB
MADEDKQECPECPPVVECKAGAPEWMATFSDLVTLLLTFFVLLYAMSKTDESKFQSVAGSIRKAFAGNAMKIGETIQLGKSPDDSPTMIESEKPIQPFPIDLITTEGMLDKHEINRESDEDIADMSAVLRSYDLVNSIDMYQISEGIQIRVKDKVFFAEGSTKMVGNEIVPVLSKVINLMKDNDWVLYVEGYADLGEKWTEDKASDAWDLSYRRAIEVTRSLVKRGVRPNKITTLFYGDSRAKRGELNRKVEFVLRKRDLRTEGKRVTPK